MLCSGLDPTAHEGQLEGWVHTSSYRVSLVRFFSNSLSFRECVPPLKSKAEFAYSARLLASEQLGVLGEMDVLLPSGEP